MMVEFNRFIHQINYIWDDSHFEDNNPFISCIIFVSPGLHAYNFELFFVLDWQSTKAKEPSLHTFLNSICMKVNATNSTGI